MNLFPASTRFDAGLVTYPPKGRFGPRRQRSYQICPVHTGSMRLRLDGQSLTVQAGQSVLLVPGHEESFQFAADRSTEHSWIHARIPSAEPPLPELSPHGGLVLPTSALLETLVRRAVDLQFRPEPAARRVFRHLAEGAFLEWLHLCSRQHPDEAPLPPPLQRAILEVQRQGERLASASDLASAAGVTPQHLGKLFRQHLGTTPARFLWTQRRERGLQLLRETGLSISEIAARCGYQSPFHFSRVVKEHTGHAPRELRQRGRQ